MFMPRKPTGPKSGSVSRFYWGWVMSLKVELITGPCTPHLHGIFFSIHLLLIYMSSSLKWISCRIHRVGSCFFVYSDNIFSPPVLWRCYWQKLCIFKVFKMFWYVYTLWNVYHNQAKLIYPLPDSDLFLMCNENTLKLTLLTNFKYNTLLLTIIIILHIKSPECIHFITGVLYPLTNVSPFPHPPVPGKYHSTLSYYEFSFIIL